MVGKWSKKLNVRPVFLYLLMAVIFFALIIMINQPMYTVDRLSKDSALKREENAYINHQGLTPLESESLMKGNQSIDSSQFLLAIQEEMGNRQIQLMEYQTIADATYGNNKYGITMVGSYQELLEIISWMEQQQYFIAIDSISFIRQEGEDYRKDSNYLCSFYVFNKG